MIASGKHAAAAGWRRIEMSFAAYQLEISVDGVSLTGQPAPVTLGSGTSGVGSSWANVVFDNLTLTANAESTPGSFLFDCLPGQELVNLTGWAGMAVEAKATVAITRLGRYKTLGNRQTHAMGIFRASDHAAMLPSGSRPAVGMSCEADLLGFCWTAPFAPVHLVPGATYYIVAEETTDGDLATEMADAARMTTHAHRDGSTIMSYNNGAVEVTGRVAKVNGSWMVTPELDTSQRSRPLRQPLQSTRFASLRAGLAPVYGSGTAARPADFNTTWQLTNDIEGGLSGMFTNLKAQTSRRPDEQPVRGLLGRIELGEDGARVWRRRYICVVTLTGTCLSGGAPSSALAST